MRSRLYLLLVLLTVPSIAFAVSLGLEWRLNSEMRAALAEQYPREPAERVASFTVAGLCAVARDDAPELCGERDTLVTIRRGAVATAVAGLLLVAGIHLAARGAARDRQRLVRLFSPGLYVTLAAVLVLTCAHAVLAIVALYYGESWLLGRVHVGIIAGIALGALLGLLAVYRGVTSVAHRAETSVFGEVVSREEAPRLWQHVDGLAERLGALRPDQVVVGLDPTFFVTEADVQCLTGRLTGRTLFCSLPLARILTVPEFSAVIGHELGHFKGQDTEFSRRFYPIYRGSATSLASLQGSASQSVSALVPMLPAIVTLSEFMEQFALVERAIGRDREFEADRAGASVATPADLAAALVKVHAYADCWDDVQEHAIDALRAGTPPANVSVAFADAVKSASTPEVLTRLPEDALPHPTDTHPPLQARLDSLAVPLASVRDASLDVPPAHAATTVFDDLEARERSLSARHLELLAPYAALPPAEIPPSETVSAG